MKTNLVLIGLGNIGRRHLQALSRLDWPGGNTLYDFDERALIGLQGTTDLTVAMNAINPESMVVIATTAKGREPLVVKALEKKPRAMIVEKPLCQNEKEYRSIKEAAQKAGVPVYINFSRQSYDYYREIQRELANDPAEKTFLAVFSGGMACIGIHVLELMRWIMRPSRYQISHMRNLQVYETKRPGYFDCYGEMALVLDEKDMCVLKACQEADVLTVKIISGNKQYDIFELSKTMYKNDRSQKITSWPIVIPYLSDQTDIFVRELLDKGSTDLLPNVEQAFLSHQILFEYLKRSGLEGINVT